MRPTTNASSDFPRVAAGTIATAALTGPSGRLGALEPRPALSATAAGWRLDGVADYVPDLPAAEVVVLAADLAGEPALVLMGPTELAEVVVEPVPMFDLSRSFGRLRATSVVLPSDALMARAVPKRRTPSRPWLRGAQPGWQPTVWGSQNTCWIRPCATRAPVRI